MIGKNLGDRIQGEKIILEAGKIDLVRKIVRSQGHRGGKAVGKTNAVATVDKPFSYVRPEPLQAKES
jgi:hypothetical protein